MRARAQRARLRVLCGAEDEPERPPSPSVHKSAAEDDGEQVLFEAKSKLFFRGEVTPAGCAANMLMLTALCCTSQDNAWSARGMGNLQLRRPLDTAAGASARLILRNDTGKAMLNAKLYSGMKVVIKEGKSVCTTVFNVVAPSAPVATPEAADKPAQPAPPAEPAQPKPVMTCVRGAACVLHCALVVLSCTCMQDAALQDKRGGFEAEAADGRLPTQVKWQLRFARSSSAGARRFGGGLVRQCRISGDVALSSCEQHAVARVCVPAQ